jgi:hypothetical protein
MFNDIWEQCTASVYTFEEYAETKAVTDWFIGLFFDPECGGDTFV